MNTALSRRLRRLEEQLPPTRERQKMEIHFICPVKGVVDSMVVELGDYVDGPRVGGRNRYKFR